MSKLFWSALKAAPAILAGSLVATNAAMAQTEINNQPSVDATLQQINRYNRAGSRSMSQVTNVNQLRDVSPADWAYEALRSLVDRYGCIVGYPDQTYKGNKALSRYEFAAGLNACLNQIERLIASSEAVAREDIETVNRLLQEFEAELATLGGRVDSLEGRTAFLEDNQFSTTTKLKGEIIFAVGQVFGEDTDSQVTFSDRVRLNFNSSFTGKDRLRTRLQAGNVAGFRSSVSGTDSSRVGFDANNGNNVELDDLQYRFPVSDNLRLWVGTNSLSNHNVLDHGNPYLISSGSGALSRFGRRNPLIFRTVAGAGVGANVKLGKALKFNAAYLSNDAADPSQSEGLFNGSYSASGQIVLEPTDNFKLNFAYVRSYQTGDDVNFSGSTVSGNAKRPFGRVDSTGNHFGLGANLDFGKIALTGWGGYIDASEADGNGEADIWTWNANVAFPDLGKEGALGAIGVGMVPKLTGGDNVTEDEDTSLLIEALYKYPLNKNISVTPGAYVVTNPDHDDSNDAVWVGLIRTTFKF